MTTPSPPPTCEFQSEPMAVTQVSQPLGMVDTHCSPEQAKTNKRTKYKTKEQNTKQEQNIKQEHKKQETRNKNKARTDQQEQINKNKTTRTKQQHKTRTNKHRSEDTKPHPSYPLSHKHEPCTYGSDPTLE